MFLST